MNTFTDWIIAYMAVISAGLTFGLLVTAWWAASAARDTLAQMQADSAAQTLDSARATRPYVGARLTPGLAGRDTWDLVLHNSGRTAAHDVRLEIQPDEELSGMVAGHVLRLAEAGQTLHPGASIRSYWVIGASGPTPEGLPRAVVIVRYVDSAGERYEEPPVVLDPNDMGLTPVPTHGAETDDKDSERDTVLALRAIARNIGEANR